MPAGAPAPPSCAARADARGGADSLPITVYFAAARCDARAACRHRRSAPAEVQMAIDIKKMNHAQLNELIQRAESRKNELHRERAAKVREKLAALAKAEGFAIEELFGTRGRKTRRAAKPKF